MVKSQMYRVYCQSHVCQFVRASFTRNFKFWAKKQKQFLEKNKMQESVRLWLPSKEHESCENLFQFVSQKGFFALFCIHVHWPGGRLYKTYNNVCVIR
jgi:hypothetical protein